MTTPRSWRADDEGVADTIGNVLLVGITVTLAAGLGTFLTGVAVQATLHGTLVDQRLSP